MKMPEAADYLVHTKRLLQKKMHKHALALLKEGLAAYPENAFLQSYYGALLAIVAGAHDRGIRTSEQALKQLEATVPFRTEAHYPLFYLNIGRAYIAKGERKKGLFYFRKGLQYDRMNPDILEEMDSMGVRRRPAIAGLTRSHPLNKYIGLLLHKLGQ